MGPRLATGHVLDVRATNYEAETTAFGGTAAMNLDHVLFHHDAQHITRLTTTWPLLGERETSVLLISTMRRAAGLEGHERGDVWARVAHDRPLTSHVETMQIARLVANRKPLLYTSTAPTGELNGEGEPVAVSTPWFDAFRTFGTPAWLL